jgi:hypothetical protein
MHRFSHTHTRLIQIPTMIFPMLESCFIQSMELSLLIYSPLKAKRLSHLIFDGLFTHRGILYHISTIPNYRASRREHEDISIVSRFARDDMHKNAKMVIFSDTTKEDAFSVNSQHQSLLKRGEDSELSSGCGFDSIPQPREENFISLDKRYLYFDNF